MKEADFPEGTCVVKLREELKLTTKDAEGNIDVNSSAAQISHALKNPNAHHPTTTSNTITLTHHEQSGVNFKAKENCTLSIISRHSDWSLASKTYQSTIDRVGAVEIDQGIAGQLRFEEGGNQLDFEKT